MSPETIHLLLDIRQRVDPFLQYHISNVINKPTPRQITTFIRDRFTSLEINDTYVNEVVISFLQFVGKFVMNRKLLKLFFLPNLDAKEDLEKLFWCLTLCVTTLIYNKLEWSHREHVALHFKLAEFFKGKPEMITELLVEDLGVIDSIPPKTEFESKYYDPIILLPSNWGPLVWRTIHLTAKCIRRRSDDHENMKYCKEVWKDFTQNSLHRILACGVCEHHYQRLLQDFAVKFCGASNDEYPLVWFELHNEVRRSVSQSPMDITDFSKEQDLMMQLLK